MESRNDLPDPEIARAAAEDAAALHELQRLAYRSEAELYDDWTIPPLHEPLAATARALAESLVLKATLAGRLIGSVRGRIEGGTCHVGRLIVHPEWQGRGLGTRVMQALEAATSSVRRYELFTGERSGRNLRLYAKLGYREFRRAVLSERVTLIHLEKCRR